MKRKYKLPPVVRVTICGSKAVMEGLKRKAFAHEMTLSDFLRKAGLEYNPVNARINDGGKIINIEEIK